MKAYASCAKLVRRVPGAPFLTISSSGMGLQKPDSPIPLPHRPHKTRATPRSPSPSAQDKSCQAPKRPKPNIPNQIELAQHPHAEAYNNNRSKITGPELNQHTAHRSAAGRSIAAAGVSGRRSLAAEVAGKAKQPDCPFHTTTNTSAPRNPPAQA